MPVRVKFQTVTAEMDAPTSLEISKLEDVTATDSVHTVKGPTTTTNLAEN
jgi:hypothetical protein